MISISLYSISLSKSSLISRRTIALISSRSCSTGPKNKHLYAALRRPVTWASLGIMTVVGGGILMYYMAEKERITQSGILALILRFLYVNVSFR